MDSAKLPLSSFVLSIETEIKCLTSVNFVTVRNERRGIFAVGGPVPKDFYQRVQVLENRVLHLESISPEYFCQVLSFN